MYLKFSVAKIYRSPFIFFMFGKYDREWRLLWFSVLAASENMPSSDEDEEDLKKSLNFFSLVRHENAKKLRITDNNTNIIFNEISQNIENSVKS